MGYSSQFRFIPNQTSEFEAKVESLHRLHQGQTPADSELNYLEEAKHLAMYGIDLHQAKVSSYFNYYGTFSFFSFKIGL